MKSLILLLSASTMISGAVLAAPPTAKTGTKGDTAASVGPVAPQTAAKPQFGDFGFDAAGMDRSITPGDNFARYTGGTWEKVTQIPNDRGRFGAFDTLADLSTERTRGILEGEAARPGSKIGDLYASFMDEAGIEAKGIEPLRPTIAAIKAAKTRSAIAGEMGKGARLGVDTPFAIGVGPDDKNPDIYMVGMRQGGLGLPDRDYYLKPDAQLAQNRAAYQQHLTRMFALAGEPAAEARVAAVIALETRLAQAHWSRIENRDTEKTYNRWSRADFVAKAPGFDWTAFFAGTGVPVQATYVVAQPTAFAGEARIIQEAPIAVLQDYLLARTLNAYAPYLSKKFVDERFAFYGTTLGGTPENRPRWRRGTTLVSMAMGEAVGPLYTAKYFPPESKAAVDQLVRNLIAAYDKRLQNLTWMAPETKAKARAKLAAFTPKIGYPDHWRDYSALTVDRADLVGNVMRANAFEFDRTVRQLGTKMDRSEWGMAPMTVNAYANPVWNEVVFPAAILQPPFFDPKADAAVNYGGIGAVIGHELSHHFDDQGRHYDATGRLADWWTPTDVTRFTALTDALVKEYDAYEPIPGQHVQGALTLGENIADLAGMTVAYDAYRISLGGKPAAVIDGFTGDQRFYLGWAQVWRSKYREPTLRQQLLTDPHSPGEQRASVVRNLDPWYQAFDVKPGQALYLTPEQRVHIW